MNKRQKKKQLAIWYRKDYKALRKYCQRRRLDNPKLDWHLPRFEKWKKGIIFQNRCRKIFGLPASPIYPSRIMGLMILAHSMRQLKYSEHDVKVTTEVMNNENILEKTQKIL